MTVESITPGVADANWRKSCKEPLESISVACPLPRETSFYRIKNHPWHCFFDSFSSNTCRNPGCSGCLPHHPLRVPVSTCNILPTPQRQARQRMEETVTSPCGKIALGLEQRVSQRLQK